MKWYRIKTVIAKRRCRATMLMDVTVGIVLTTAAMAALTQTVLLLVEHRHTQRQVQQGIDLLANLNEMCDVETLPLNEPDSPEYREKVEPLETLTANSLPDGKFKIETLPFADDSLSVVRLTVSWDIGASRPRRELEFLRAVPKP